MIGSNQRSVIAVAMVLLCGCTQQPEPTSIVVSPVAVQSEVISTGPALGPRLVGVGSCTASGCHGGAAPDQIVGSEYNIWISADPHSQAHSVLYDDESLQIVKKLDGKAWNPAKPPYEDQRCLSCHSTTFASAVNAAGEVLTDGVGCEACHGPAENWLSEHYLPGFSDADRERLSMWNTKDIFSRSQICAGCHVGSPGREVNHDMIAAGHPRLQFEMGAYLQALPKHWRERRDRERTGGSFEFKVWALGQTATSQAAIKQLAERATHGKVWPELSEWSCGACHHNLLDSVERQQSLAKAGGLSGQKIRWDDWNHHVVQSTARQIATILGFDDSIGELDQDMASLADAAGSLRADREKVAESARVVSDQLTNWAQQLQQAPIDMPALDKLMHSLVGNYSQQGVIDFSQAMLVYDALASLQQSRLDMLAVENSEPTALDTAITAKLGEMYLALTQENSAPDAEITRTKRLNEQLKELAQLIPSQEKSP